MRSLFGPPRKKDIVATCDLQQFERLSPQKNSLQARAEPPSGKSNHRAFTILEILAVMLILMILAALVVPNFSSWVAKAQEARCMANMRAIHLGLSSYLNDNANVWPQGPPPETDAAWSQFWIQTLEPQGVPAKTWQCPTIAGLIGRAEDVPFDAASIHYIPTMFAPTPGVARRWPTQPWLVERMDAHGQGPLICFTDGSIKSFNKVLAEQGLR
jgi:type II secretory pathway pseudopilin PulG